MNLDQLIIGAKRPTNPSGFFELGVFRNAKSLEKFFLAVHDVNKDVFWRAVDAAFDG